MGTSPQLDKYKDRTPVPEGIILESLLQHPLTLYSPNPTLHNRISTRCSSAFSSFLPLCRLWFLDSYKHDKLGAPGVGLQSALQDRGPILRGVSVYKCLMQDSAEVSKVARDEGRFPRLTVL